MADMKPTEVVLSQNRPSPSKLLDKADSKKKQNESGLHFSKTLLQIFNKSLSESSTLNRLPTDFWLTNKNVYQLLETGLCDYYIERLYST